MPADDCIFCKIISGDIPGEFVREGPNVVAFEDIQPRAPTHILIVPREHIPSVNELSEDRGPVIGELFLAARDLAKERGLSESGYRLVMNTGRGAGQSVFHIHLHLLGGRPLEWPPG